MHLVSNMYVACYNSPMQPRKRSARYVWVCLMKKMSWNSCLVLTDSTHLVYCPGFRRYIWDVFSFKPFIQPPTHSSIYPISNLLFNYHKDTAFSLHLLKHISVDAVISSLINTIPSLLTNRPTQFSLTYHPRLNPQSPNQLTNPVLTHLPPKSQSPVS